MLFIYPTVCFGSLVKIHLSFKGKVGAVVVLGSKNKKNLKKSWSKRTPLTILDPPPKPLT